MPRSAVRTAVLLSCALMWPAAYAATDLNPGPDPLGVKQTPQDVLKIDEAFALSAKLSEDGFLEATWRMPDGYYLYRHRFTFSDEEEALGAPIIPDGKSRTDEFFGDVEVYYGEVTVRVPVLRQNADMDVEIGYQGCADFGFCYPPEKKRFTFSKPVP